MSLRGAFLLFVVLLLGAETREAAATTAADIPCAAGSTSELCILASTVAVGDLSTLDFGTRGLDVTGAGALDAGTGSMTIIAASLRVEPGGRLVSNGGSIGVETTGAIRLESATSRSRIDVSGASGGDITLTAGGEVYLAGRLLANATTAQNDGGSIDVTGATVTVVATGELAAKDGGNGYGGDICITADASLIVAGVLDMSGANDAGMLMLEANGDVTTTATAVLNGKGGPGGYGACMEIDSDSGAVSLAGMIAGHAGGSLDLGGGTGADLTVFAATAITVDASVDVSGGGLGASGGCADFEADGDIVQRGPVDATAARSGGQMGEVSWTTTTGSITLSASVQAGGPARGGDISAFGWGPIGVTGSGRLVSDGPNARVTLTGCGIDVARGATLSSQGPGGLNLVQASGEMTIAGTLLATGGANRFEVIGPSVPLGLTGSTITPPPTIDTNPNLVPCGGFTTTTTLAGGSSTTTTTTTSLPAVTTTITTRPPTTTAPSVTTTTTALAPRCVPADCDDGDACTDDRCDDVLGCVNQPRSGLDAVTCKLDTIGATVGTTSADELGGAVARARLEDKVGQVRRPLEAARTSQGRRAVMKLRRASRLLGALIHFLEKAEQRGKLGRGVGDRLLGLASDAASSLLQLLRG